MKSLAKDTAIYGLSSIIGRFLNYLLVPLYTYKIAAASGGYGVSSAVQSAVLALRGTCIPSTDGIIEDDIEKTVRNLGAIGSVGMQATDRMILDIMLCK